MSSNTRKHLPTVTKRCEVDGYVFMSVGQGPGAVDIRLAFPRPVELDRYGNEQTGKCPLHPQGR